MKSFTYIAKYDTPTINGRVEGDFRANDVDEAAILISRDVALMLSIQESDIVHLHIKEE